MVPGPTSVPAEVLAAYALDYGSGDLEDEFFALYDRVQQQLRHILATRNQVAVMTGEGMLALWAGLKSCLRPDDWVLAVATGLFGDGIGEMARALGAEVEIVSFPHDTVASAAGARLCTDSATWARKPTSTWSSGRSRRSPRPCVGPPEVTGRRKSIVALRTATRKSWKPSGCPSVSTSVVGSRSGARVGSLAS